MTMLSKLGRFLQARAENFVVLLLASMFVSFLIQIVFRYVLNLPLGWTIEYVAIAWLWGILFGYAFVVRDDEVIRLDIVYYAVPIPVRRFMDISAGLTIAGVLLWSLPQAYDYVDFMKIERTAFLRLRFDWLFSIYVPFAGAVIIRNLRTVWRGIRGVGYDVSPHLPDEVESHV